MTAKSKPKIAIWHRYGPEGHTTCGGHAMPFIVRELAKHADVHYFGMHTDGEVSALIREHAVLHYLPLHFNRSSNRDKFFKTILWYLAMPFMALKCRFMGVKAIYNDETVPPTAPILAVNLKGIAEAVKDGQTGYRFDANDTDTFKRHLTELATTPSLREQFGTAALETSRHLCSIDLAVDATTAPLMQLIRP